jgi:hypothetical protein
MIIILVRKAFIYLMAKLIQFTPHIKEIHFTDKEFIINPVMNQDAIKQLELFFIHHF